MTQEPFDDHRRPSPERPSRPTANCRANRSGGAHLGQSDQPDALLEALWADEANDRMAAYRRGEIKAVASIVVIAKYNQSAS